MKQQDEVDAQNEAYDPRLRQGMSGKEFAEHSDQYAVDFINDAGWLSRIIGQSGQDLPIEYKHIGSSSIPNMPGKPIIDIAMGIKNPEDVGEILKILIDQGYVSRKNYSDGPHMMLKNKQGVVHALHLTGENTGRWNQLLAFKQYLTNNEQAHSEYKIAKIEANQSRISANGGQGVYQKLKHGTATKLNEEAREFCNVKSNQELNEQFKQAFTRVYEDYNIEVNKAFGTNSNLQTNLISTISEHNHN